MRKFTIAFTLENKAHPYDNPMATMTDDYESTSRATGDHISATTAPYNKTLNEEAKCHTLPIVDARDHFSSGVYDTRKTMVWAGVIRAIAIPNDLKVRLILYWSIAELSKI
jgi:hypothetical protein